MKRKQNRKQKGFTLIELLVVVSIIGLLSSMVLASMKSAKDKANIAAFIQNVHQLQIALEMYKLDTGYYPYENDALAKSFENPNYLSGNDDVTNALTTIVVGSITQKSFLPIYILKFPKRITLTDVIGYMNLKYAFSNNYTCGNTTPTKGYLIYYTNSQSSAYNLPLLHLFYNNVAQPEYCVATS